MSAAPSPNGGSRRKKKTELACQPKLADANTARLRQGFGGQPSLCFASEGWCRGRDSNPRPPHYECGALPAELPRHTSECRRDNTRAMLRQGTMPAFPTTGPVGFV